MESSNEPSGNSSSENETDDSTISKLVESAKTDRNAVAELYRVHYGLVAAYVYRRMGRIEDANDVIAEVFIAMVNGLPYFRWRGIPFRIWLYRIATNKISRWARRRHCTLQAQALDNVPANSEHEHHDYDSELIGMALECLPTKLQDVLTLHYLEGLRISEIASILRCSEGTVKSRLHAGRIAMRQQLARRGVYDE